MAAPSMTSTVYLHVIEDVISKVRDEFVNNGGPGEEVLNELQGIWETKMMQAGAVLGPVDRSVATKPPPGGATAPVHDLNVPYEVTEEFETPTTDILFPPTPLQTPIPTPLPGTVDSSMYNIPTGSSDYPTPSNDGVGNSGGNTDIKAGRPSPYMRPPSPWMNQRPPLGVDVNVAYMEAREDGDRGTSNQPHTQDFFMSSGKRKREDLVPRYQNGGYIPQQDGAGDAVFEDSQITEKTTVLSTTDTRNRQMLAHVGRPLSKIPQVDGQTPDPYDEMLSTPNIYNYQGVVNEDYNIASTPAPNDLQAATPAIGVHNDVGDDEDEDEPPLNENDDDEDDLDDVDEGEELNTQHLVLAQFDKVTRTKSKWKCTLKDGIMHINNKDILFNKATGEFDF
ncbi:transcription initiation factor IIA large subunit-like [Rhodamnia argentea]|uniref:Transcription initiation factor IIA large subunit-like n=1 Tax=Rhodamnia argentea TaxID=178133 RepID=A0A8B8NPP7_9MYRT|nr:transcription initiation factor IIA large subunit-like [Rhodamnia argentea]